MDKARELMRRLSDSFRPISEGTYVIKGPEWVDELTTDLNCNWKIVEHIASGLRYHTSDLWEVHIDGICQDLVDVGNADLLDWVREDLSREEYIARALESELPRENDFFHMVQCGQYEYYREIAGELISAIEELAEKACPFVVGYNQAGYLPEEDPSYIRDFDSAKEWIIYELETVGTVRLALQDAVEKALGKVRIQTGPFCIQVADYEYWVQLRKDWLEDPTGE